MRSVGATHARCGELELQLGPSPLTPAAEVHVEPPSTDDDDGRDLDTLLFSSGVDVDAVRAVAKRLGVAA